MRFKDRYAAMKNRQGKDWWTITFGDPISWIILGVIGDQKWVTPTGITWVSFFAKMIPAGLMVTIDRTAIIAAVILLQFGQVLDSMDGNLARYRGTSCWRDAGWAGFIIINSANAEGCPSCYSCCRESRGN